MDDCICLDVVYSFSWLEERHHWQHPSHLVGHLFYLLEAAILLCPLILKLYSQVENAWGENIVYQSGGDKNNRGMSF